MKRNIYTLSNQGFCFGVDSAIKKIVNFDFTNYELPIYILGDLVHNKYVSSYFENLGFIILRGHDKYALIDSIDKGTVILTAHGSSQKLLDYIEKRNLSVINTMCPHVNKSFRLIEEKINKGYDVLYIGKNLHPESMAALEISNKVHLIENIEDINKYTTLTKVCITNQTTMSVFDIKDIVDKFLAVFPNGKILNKVCMASKERQKELMEKSKLADYIIIVGDTLSNNTKKLYSIACGNRSLDNVIMVNNVSEINIDIVKNKENILIASGASTPNSIVYEIVDTLNDIDNINKPYIKSKIDNTNVLKY